MEIRKKLEEEVGITNWEDLTFFVKLGKLILLDNSLDIVEVGIEMSKNNSEYIGNLISDKKLTKVDFIIFDELSDKELKCLIIEPFVLCKASTKISISKN